MKYLAQVGVTSVLCEGGGELSASLIKEGLVDEAFQRALRLVEENSDGLEILAEALEQREVLEAKEIRELMSGTGVPGGREPVLA